MKKKFLAILSAAMIFSVMGAGSAGAAPAKAVPSESHITLKSGSVNVYDYGDVSCTLILQTTRLPTLLTLLKAKRLLPVLNCLPLPPGLIPGKIMFNRSANP